MGKWVVVCLSIALLAFAAVTFNELVAARYRVSTAWSGIDVELQRRHDLIPQLAATVQGYATHEQATLSAVAELRSRAQSTSSPARRGELEAQLGAQASRLLGLQERYPELKANGNFLALQKQLAETEDRIGAARDAYNASVQQYNMQLETFPDLPIARLFRFAPRDYFQAVDAAALAPRAGGPT